MLTILALGMAIGMAGAQPLTDLKTALGAPDPARRAEAAKALSKPGSDAYAFLGELRALLADPDALVRYWAACALAVPGPGAAVAIPDVLPLLADPDRSVRSAAAWALGEMGPAASVAIPALAANLTHADERTRSTAATALVKIGEPALPTLIEAIGSDNTQLRTDVTSALRGHFGMETDPRVPSVTERNVAEIVERAFPPGAGDGVSLLPNGSFETAGDDGVPGWELVLLDGARGSMAVDDSQARTGRHSLRFEKTNAHGLLLLRSQHPIELPPRATHTFRAYFRADDAPPNAGLLLRFQDASGRLLVGEPHRGHVLQSQTLLRNAPPGHWEKRVAEFATADEPVALFACVVLYGNPATVWLDDLTLPSVPYQVRYSAPVATLPRYSRDQALTMLEQRESATGSIRAENGLTTLRVDGRPAAPAFYHIWRSLFADYAYMEQYGDVRLLTVTIDINDNFAPDYPPSYPVWTRTGEYDFTSPFLALEMLARKAPESYAILHFSVAWPQDWVDRHPDQAWVNAAGERAKGVPTHFSGFGGELRGNQRWWPSPSSGIALEDASRVIRAFLDELKQTPYHRFVVGCMISGGHDGQFYTTNWPDHSEPGKRDFRQWLRAHYPTVEVLRRAWHDGQVDFETADLPPGGRAEDRDPLAVTFFDPKTETPRVDYYRFSAERGMRIREYFARVFKQNIGKEAFALTWQMGGGRDHGVETVFLRSPWLDALAPQPTYELRHPGYYGGIRAPADAYRLHGKLAIKELDLRTWLRAGGNEVQTQRLGAALTPEWFRNVNRKEIGQMLAGRQGYWYYDIGSTHFRDLAMMQEIRAAREVAGKVAARQTAFRPDAVVVTDEKSMYWAQPLYTGRGTPSVLGRYTPMMFKTSGVPYAEHYLADLMARPDLRDWKVIVFLDVWRLTEKERAFIETLKTDGRTLVWCYAPGVAAETGLDLEAMSRLLGMRVETAPEAARTAAFTVPANDPLAATLPPLLGMGEAYRGRYPQSKAPILHLDVQRFWIDDPQTTPLARYEDGKTAVAVRRFPEWTSVYLAPPAAMEAQLLHNIAREAGAYVATTPGPALEMNGDFISLYSLRNGRWEITLPRRCTVRDAETGTVIVADAPSFAVDLPAQAVRWFLLE